jgi:hypothetical protein
MSGAGAVTTRAAYTDRLVAVVTMPRLILYPSAATNLLAPEQHTIRCYAQVRLPSRISSASLTADRLLAVQATRLLMRLDTLLSEARADWNQDRFRRLMRLRPKAVVRLRRRWEKLNPSPRIPLGSLRRRYHANLAGHLYPVSQD